MSAELLGMIEVILMAGGVSVGVKIASQLSRLETKVEQVLGDILDHEKRIRKLEKGS